MIPKTLFARTVLIISSLLFVFVLLASSVIFYYIMTPMARQSASHLAALVALSAQTWVELPPETRHDFELELKRQHNISLRSRKQNFQAVSVHTPFFNYFQQEIQQLLGQDIEVLEEYNPEFWIWVKVPIAARTLYIGFSHNIIGPNPSLVVFILIIAAAVLVIISSFFLVSYLVRPINKLLIATRQLGQGNSPEQIIESGPEELVQLTRSFNTMNREIQELLQNRTVLLAGISHDLRTPIARIYLALEMLNAQQDKNLIKGVKNDLHDMNQLIQRTLEFSRGLNINTQDYQSIDISCYIQKYIAAHPYSELIHFVIDSSQDKAAFKLSVPLNVLERILDNLLENALKYSQNKAVNIRLNAQPDYCHIVLQDMGPGIPEQQLNTVFQPFYRLEASRNTETGGSGLGLAIVQQLCQAYAWHIQLKNRAEGGLEAILSIAYH